MTRATGVAMDILATLERVARHLGQRDTAQEVTAALGQIAHQLRGDGLEIAPLCEEELVFRAVRWIVGSALDPLEAAIAALEHAADAAGDWGTWRRLLPGIPTARAELGRLTQRWLAHRDGETTLSPDTLPPYRDAVAQALADLRKLDEIPTVEGLLYRGVAFHERPAIARSCEQCLAALRVGVDIQKARRFFRAYSLWERAVGRAPGPVGVRR